MSADDCVCPACGNSNFKVWKLPNPLMMHWVLNPGLAVNELVLGQRLPAESVECKSCELPLSHRTYVICPHCSGMHCSTRWMGRRGFGNWLGLVCPDCCGRIPCLWNLLSIVILAILSPLWYLPYRFYFRDRKGAPPAPLKENPPSVPGKKTFIRMAFVWAGAIWVAMSLVPELVKMGRGVPPSPAALGSGLVIWSGAGVFFGVCTYFLSSRKKASRVPDASGKY